LVRRLIPPTMFKLFVLCLSILSLICGIQCGTASKRGGPSPKPGTLVARGHCDFHCLYENAAGRELSESSAHSERLYCGYGVGEAVDKVYCVYNRNNGELLPGSSPAECDRRAVFYCPGTKNSQEDMKFVPSQPKDSRSVNLPQFVKARSKARRAVEANAA